MSPAEAVIAALAGFSLCLSLFAVRLARAAGSDALASVVRSNSNARRIQEQGRDVSDLRQRVSDLEGPAQGGGQVDGSAVPPTVHERGWQWRPTADDTAFAPPFGTIRVCRVCGCLVSGGPTACVRCADGGSQ